MSLLKPKVDTEGQPPQVDEDRDERKIRVTVFPEGGGRPYVRDVEVDEEGMFEIDGKRGTWVLRPGSVWEEGGVERCIIHEDRPETVNPDTLNGTELMHPETLHGVAKNNLWVQLDEVSKAHRAWKNPQTVVMIVMAGLLLLLLFWQIRTMGDGFEQLADAIRTAEFAANSGHQPIAPEG